MDNSTTSIFVNFIEESLVKCHLLRFSHLEYRKFLVSKNSNNKNQCLIAAGLKTVSQTHFAIVKNTKHENIVAVTAAAIIVSLKIYILYPPFLIFSSVCKILYCFKCKSVDCHLSEITLHYFLEWKLFCCLFEVKVWEIENHSKDMLFPIIVHKFKIRSKIRG